MACKQVAEESRWRATCPPSTPSRSCLPPRSLHSCRLPWTAPRKATWVTWMRKLVARDSTVSSLARKNYSAVLSALSFRVTLTTWRRTWQVGSRLAVAARYPRCRPATRSVTLRQCTTCLAETQTIAPRRERAKWAQLRLPLPSARRLRSASPRTPTNKKYCASSKPYGVTSLPLKSMRRKTRQNSRWRQKRWTYISSSSGLTSSTTTLQLYLRFPAWHRCLWESFRNLPKTRKTVRTIARLNLTRLAAR